MAIQGLRDVSGFTVDGQRPKNYREGLLMIYRHGAEGKAPLTALTSLMGKPRIVDDPEFSWYEKEAPLRRYRLHATTGDLTTTNSTIKLVTSGDDYVSAKELKAGDMLRVEETGEIIRVANDPTSETQFIAERGFAGSTAATVDPNGDGVNPFVLVIGNAYEEGSLSPTGVARDPIKRYNHTQIFQQTLEHTRTAMKTRLRTGDAVQEAKREALEMLGIDMERAFLFGRRWEGTKNGKPIRTLGGIESVMPAANIKTANTSTGCSLSQFEEYLLEMFKYGSSEKFAFVGDQALLTIQRLVRRNGDWTFSSGLKEYGLNVMRFESPFGSLVLKRHPLLTDVAGGTNTSAFYGMNSWMWVMDMAHLKYVCLKDSDIKYRPKLQANDLDGEKSGYLGECSIEISNPNAFYLVKNLAVSAIDGTGAI